MFVRFGISLFTALVCAACVPAETESQGSDGAGGAGGAPAATDCCTACPGVMPDGLSPYATCTNLYGGTQSALECLNAEPDGASCEPSSPLCSRANPGALPALFCCMGVGVPGNACVDQPCADQSASDGSCSATYGAAYFAQCVTSTACQSPAGCITYSADTFCCAQ